jgi:hypothetical protein
MPGLPWPDDGQGIDRMRLAVGLQGGLFVDQLGVGAPGVGGNQREPRRVVHIVRLILRPRRGQLDLRAAVRQPRDQAQQHRHLELLGQLKRLARHVVTLLLVGGFQARHHGKVGKVARILLVLRAVHRRVIGHHNHQPAVRARHRHVHERVGRHIQPHVFHRHDRTATGVGHAHTFFKCHFFIGGPETLDRQAVLFGVVFDRLVNLGRWGAGVGVSGGDASVYGGASHGFVAQQDQVRHELSRSVRVAMINRCPSQFAGDRWSGLHKSTGLQNIGNLSLSPSESRSF